MHVKFFKNPERYFGSEACMKRYIKSIRGIVSACLEMAYSGPGNGLDWSQQRLSEESGLSRYTLMRLENCLEDDRPIRCYFDTIWRLCHALKFELHIKKNGTAEIIPTKHLKAA
jgi:DNA-binding Xre family transcriptional regulator